MSGARFNPRNQVPRHGIGEPLSANQQMHVLRVPDKKNGRLAGRVPSSDNSHLLVGAELSLHLRGSVVDTDAFKLSEIGQIEFSILRARGYDDAAGLHGSPIVEFHGVRCACALERASGAGHGDMGPELLRLHESAAREFLPGDSIGKPEIVFDSGTRPGLPAGRVALDYQHFQPLRRPVDRRCQAAGSGADDDQVIHAVLVDSRIQAEAFSHLGVAGISKNQFAPANQHGDIGDTNLKLIQNALNVRSRAPRRRRCGDGRCAPGTRADAECRRNGWIRSARHRRLMGDQVHPAHQERAQENSPMAASV